MASERQGHGSGVEANLPVRWFRRLARPRIPHRRQMKARRKNHPIPASRSDRIEQGAKKRNKRPLLK